MEIAVDCVDNVTIKLKKYIISGVLYNSTNCTTTLLRTISGIVKLL